MEEVEGEKVEEVEGEKVEEVEEDHHLLNPRPMYLSNPPNRSKM